MSPTPFEQVWRVVRAIPRGRVMTYGQIAAAIEGRLSPVAVGWAMAGCPGDVPWHRVVNARGACSTGGRGDLPPGLQQALLRAEGVRFDGEGRLDLARYRWEPAPQPRHRGRAGPRPRQGAR